MSMSFKWVCFMAILTMVFALPDCRAGGDGFVPRDAGLQGKRTMARTVDKVYQDTQWRLEIYLNNKGTRSQGSMGLLYSGTEPVRGKKGEIRDISIGKVRYNGPEAGRKHLWDATGWQMLDPRVSPVVHGADPTIPRPGMLGKDMSRLAKELEQTDGRNGN